MSYRVRSRTGELKFGLSNRHAGDIIDSVSGEFQEKIFNDGKKTVFVLTEDHGFTIVGVNLYFWKGDYIEKVAT